MSELVAKRTRALAVLIVAVFAFSAIPSMAFDGDAVPAASAAATEYEVKVGWLSDIINWNPMALAMVEDWVSCFLMYSALWQYDEKWDQPVADLASSYNMTYHADGTMTLWVNLTHNAYFRTAADPDDTSVPFTAADVVYTIEMAKSKQSTAWEYYLRDYDNVTAVDDYTVRMDVAYVKATIIDDITGIPIVSNGFYDGDIGLMDAMDPSECMGTGPFVYDDHLEGGWYKFKKADNYHGELDYGEERGVKIDYITYELSTNAGELVVKMNGGNLDVCVVTGEPDLFVNQLGSGNTDIVKESVQELGICDIAINAVPYGFRVDAPGEGNDYCNGNYHLLDKEVRKAILMTLNKQYINEEIMGGLSVQADSVIMPGYWKKDIEGVLPYDPVAARQVLLDAGYLDDGGDYLIAGPTTYVVQLAAEEGFTIPNLRLEGIRCHAPNTDPSYGFIVNAWAGWASEAGIGFSSEVVNEATMTNEEWYKCMYDIWVWHWGWGPEPLSDLSVWLTDEITIGGDNCQMPMGEWWYWEDEAEDDAYSGFDENFTLAKETVIKDDRRDIVYDLQQFVYDSYCETPPYYDVGLYGYSTARYQGWGDWSENSGRTIVSGMPWLWFDVIPSGNLMPVVDPGLQSSYEPTVDEVFTFEITVSDPDGDDLWVNWTFGDGSAPVEELYTDVSTETVVSVDHTYAAADTYTLTVTVTDGYPFHTVTDTASVVVLEDPDEGPELSALSYAPSSAYVGEETLWTVTATDPEATEMTLTFSWGDDSYEVRTLTPASVGSPVTVTDVPHTYTAADDYTVQINLWDGFGLPTSEIHNVSISRTYSVIDNTPPAAPAVPAVETNAETSTPISATTSDADPDTLTVTWDWGDGTFSVTTHDTSAAPGQTVTSAVSHTWATDGTYPFTVWVDDGNDHNVSTVGSATVNPVGTNLGPTSISLSQSPSPGYVDETVTLTVSAFDPNGDAILFTVELGDGEIAVVSSEGSVDMQIVEIEHVYTWADVYTVWVHADDGGFNVTSEAFYVTVEEPTENAAPELMLQTSYTAMYNETFTVTPVLISDADGDDLTVWYDWGDGTPLSAGNPAASYAGTHVYSTYGTVTLTAYVDDGQDLVGHNVSETSSVSVNYNRKPTVKSIVLSPLTGPYLEGQTIFFNVTVSDKEGDNVTVKILFGDGTAVESVTDILSGPDANLTVSFTHSYAAAESYTVKVWVEDEFDHPDPAWISTEKTVTIVAAPDDDKDSNLLLYVAVAGLALVIVAVVAMMLMKKRKGKASGGDGEDAGGMEGMAPPEDVPPPPGQ